MKTLALILFLAYGLLSVAGTYTGWGLQSINLPTVIKSNKEVTVAVLDTGIDSSHEFLRNSVIKFVDFSNTGNVDTHGHGTHIAGIIKSIFKKVQFVSLKYYNPSFNGEESLDATLRGLEAAVEMNVDIINYSGGGPESNARELKILKRAQEKGILVVCAAGNENSNIDNKNSAFYPAAYNLDNIIAVSAHNQDLNLVESSNYGQKTVALSAPGKRIKSSIPYNRYGYLTGTSQATAFVSGVVAILKSNFPELTPSEIKSVLIKSSKFEKKLAKYTISGGRLDTKNALLYAERENLKGNIVDALASISTKNQ